MQLRFASAVILRIRMTTRVLTLGQPVFKNRIYETIIMNENLNLKQIIKNGKYRKYKIRLEKSFMCVFI